MNSRPPHLLSPRQLGQAIIGPGTATCGIRCFEGGHYQQSDLVAIGNMRQELLHPRRTHRLGIHSKCFFMHLAIGAFQIHPTANPANRVHDQADRAHPSRLPKALGDRRVDRLHWRRATRSPRTGATRREMTRSNGPDGRRGTSPPQSPMAWRKNHPVCPARVSAACWGDRSPHR